MIFELLLAEQSRPLGEALPELFGRLHPLTVHFPIALLLSAALFEGLNALRPNETLRRGAALCLWLGTLSAFVAGGTGWVHESLEPSREADVEWHRWIGVAGAVVGLLTSVVSLSALGAKRGARSIKLYRGGLFLTALLIGGTGKIGGEMVWGSDWYFRPFEARSTFELPKIELPPIGIDADDAGPQSTEPVPDVGPVSYARHVAPILAASCYECHGPTGKADGDLRFSEMAAAQEAYFGFDWDGLIVPGDADASALAGVMLLPRDHDLAMPPRGEGEPVPAADIERVRRWINEGDELEAMLAN